LYAVLEMKILIYWSESNSWIYFIYTVKPVLRGHLWNKEKVVP
jgi:hypothetical protein